MTDAERELPTGAHNAIPEFVGEAPETIPGAPPWANELIRDVRAERAAMTALVGRIESASKMLTDAINRLIDHDSRLLVLERTVASHGRQLGELHARGGPVR
jgi:hypothetical protein